MVSAFEGNKAETKTMLPVIEKFMAAHPAGGDPGASTTGSAGSDHAASRVLIAPVCRSLPG